MLAFLATLAAGCGGSAPEAAPPAPTAIVGATTGAPAAERRVCRAGALRLQGSARRAYAAVVRNSAVAYRRPGHGVLRRFGRLNVNGVPTVLGIVGRVVDSRCETAWYRVQLPIRPNGITGYVRAADVAVGAVGTRIVVDLSERRVTLFRDGRKAFETTAAIGSSATPTPVGRFYVNQRLIPQDTTGPFGPGAIGISAFSNVLTGWTQGGPIAIHGTNRPSSIGRAVSNGCVRVRNPVLRRLFRAALAGTPVLIRR